MISSPLEIVLRVGEILNDLKIPHFLTGSIASSVLGEPRSTRDADIVAELTLADLPKLEAAMKEEFYFPLGLAQEAIQLRRSFNVIYKPFSFKVDIFVRRDTPFHQEEMRRRKTERVATNPDRFAFLPTAEDLVLAKLIWYQKGREVSDSQWRDVLGLLKTQGKNLDLVYLRKTASDLNLTSSVEKALRDSGLSN